MRVHGTFKLKRRQDPPDESDYHNYYTLLQEDFYHICGYCGKLDILTHKGFEIDHFVPQKIDKDREQDYNNLVYCCFTCNRKKSKKWPTNDKTSCNDGKVGFVDPVSDEYDLHIGRNPDGTIEYYTDIGKYMYYQAFKFDIRPTKEVWKAMQLLNKKYQLRKIQDKLSPEEMKEYIKLDECLDDLINYLFKTGE